MNAEKEQLIVIRDATNSIIAIVEKRDMSTKIYTTSIMGFDEVADLMKELINPININK